MNSLVRRADLESGAWQARNAELLKSEQADLGARLLVTEPPRDDVR